MFLSGATLEGSLIKKRIHCIYNTSFMIPIVTIISKCDGIMSIKTLARSVNPALQKCLEKKKKKHGLAEMLLKSARILATNQFRPCSNPVLFHCWGTRTLKQWDLDLVCKSISNPLHSVLFSACDHNSVLRKKDNRMWAICSLMKDSHEKNISKLERPWVFTFVEGRETLSGRLSKIFFSSNWIFYRSF